MESRRKAARPLKERRALSASVARTFARNDPYQSLVVQRELAGDGIVVLTQTVPATMRSSRGW